MPIQEIKPGFDILIYGGSRIIYADDQTPRHYWQVRIVVTLGIPGFVFTDLGTTKPT